MYDYKCEYCGSWLDPGEKCDCVERVEKKIRSRKKSNMIMQKIFEDNKLEQEELQFCK